MTPNRNRRPSGHSGSGGYSNGLATAKVIAFPASLKTVEDPFEHLTATLVMAQHRAGTLPDAVLLALLQGAGVVRP
jgi:hypothetical protein